MTQEKRNGGVDEGNEGDGEEDGEDEEEQEGAPSPEPEVGLLPRVFGLSSTRSIFLIRQ